MHLMNEYRHLSKVFKSKKFMVSGGEMQLKYNLCDQHPSLEVKSMQWNSFVQKSCQDIKSHATLIRSYSHVQFKYLERTSFLNFSAFNSFLNCAWKCKLKHSFDERCFRACLSVKIRNTGGTLLTIYGISCVSGRKVGVMLLAWQVTVMQ